MRVSVPCAQSAPSRPCRPSPPPSRCRSGSPTPPAAQGVVHVGVVGQHVAGRVRPRRAIVGTARLGRRARVIHTHRRVIGAVDGDGERAVSVPPCWSSTSTVETSVTFSPAARKSSELSVIWYVQSIAPLLVLPASGAIWKAASMAASELMSAPVGWCRRPERRSQSGAVMDAVGRSVRSTSVKWMVPPTPRWD